jgi:hypothetical protein
MGQTESRESAEMATHLQLREGAGIVSDRLEAISAAIRQIG